MIGVKSFLIVFFFTWGVKAQIIDSKYPDIIQEAKYSGINPNFKTFYGGLGKRYPITIEPEKLLNDNQHWFVSLPEGSFITFQYTNNGIINAPNQDDIRIVENGCCRMAKRKINPERAKVYISHNGKAFVLLAEINDCSPTTLDLEDIHYNKVVHYIKIEGLDYKCNPQGFDLINAYPLTGANLPLYADIKEVDKFFSNKKENRSLILENIYFENDSYDLNMHGKEDLENIILQLKKNTQIRIHLSGHTDSKASKSYNKKLSFQRAKAVKNYLQLHGIKAERIIAEGKGEDFPLKSNSTLEGRAVNRRVELRRLN